MPDYSRRDVNRYLFAGLLSTLSPGTRLAAAPVDSPPVQSPLYRLAFSSWCFHMALWRGEMKARELPELARSLDVDALEWTAKTFRDLRSGRELMYQAPPPTFFHELRAATDAAGIENRVLNVGGPFFIASTNKADQEKALDFVMQYVEPAQILGCEILRTELYFNGDHKPGWEDEAKKRALEGLHALLDRTEGSGLVINIENHHGISSHPEWLVDLFRLIGDPRFGLTVDTNNFRIDQHNPYERDADSFPRYVDRYEAMEKLMPLANWVSAKFYAFDSTGYEISMDYPRIMDIILASGYRGFVSVEYEGAGDPREGVRESVEMLRKMREYYSST